MHTRRGKGFTIIELLVVVAIIGMLAAVIMTALSSSQVSARDSRRLADVHELHKAFEFYSLDNNGRYPAAAPSPYYLADVSGLAPAYIAAIPRDPLETVAGSGNDYRYYTDAARTRGYSVAVYLEKEDAWCRVTLADIVPAAWDSYPICD